MCFQVYLHISVLCGVFNAHEFNETSACCANDSLNRVQVHQKQFWNISQVDERKNSCVNNVIIHLITFYIKIFQDAFFCWKHVVRWEFLS